MPMKTYEDIVSELETLGSAGCEYVMHSMGAVYKAPTEIKSKEDAEQFVNAVDEAGRREQLAHTMRAATLIHNMVVAAIEGDHND